MSWNEELKHWSANDDLAFPAIGFQFPKNQVRSAPPVPSNASFGFIVRKPGKLRQPVADSIPWSFGADEDVKGWTNTRIINEDTQADMSEFAITHDRKQPGATMPAKVDHVVFVFAKFGDALLTARQSKLFLANASERAEG
jgi:hypothetical protein